LPNDGLEHKYCANFCSCNPKSEAECIVRECICPYPYTGKHCYDCESGYAMESDICIQ